jgi:hypothetical protein
VTKILQIMPADGWKGAFFVPDSGAWRLAPLIGWAIVDPGVRDPEVLGLVPTGADNDVVGTVDTIETFMAYVQPTASPDERRRLDAIAARLAGEQNTD